MVRISGGIYRGRKLRVPRSGVRPTKDMVRQAMFSVLGASIAGKRVADLFAGSGAIGLEAASRGATEVVWVESDPRTFEILRGNVEDLCGRTFPCIRSDAFAWLHSPRDAGTFDLIVADPPYVPDGGEPWGARLLAALTESGKMKPDGLFVLEQHADQPVIDNPAWHVVKQGRYGETLLVYYRRSVKADTGKSPT